MVFLEERVILSSLLILQDTCQTAEKYNYVVQLIVFIDIYRPIKPFHLFGMSTIKYKILYPKMAAKSIDE